MGDDHEARQALSKWARSLTALEIDQMSEDAAKAMSQVIGFSQVLTKVKVAHDSGLSHVVLQRDEIAHLLTGLRLLTTGSKAKSYSGDHDEPAERAQ